MRRDRRAVTIVAALAVIALTARHPTASIRVLTHDRADPSPHVMRAAVDLGIVGVSVLYSWTVDTLR